MSRTPFEKITLKCSEEEYDSIHIRNHAYAIYTQRVADEIDEHKKNNSGKITGHSRKILCDSLITDQRIQEYILSAKRDVAEIKKRMEKDIVEAHKKSINWRTFWFSVTASLVGAFFYLLITSAIISYNKSVINNYLEKSINESKTKDSENSMD